jgi:hypothetical protein
LIGTWINGLTPDCFITAPSMIGFHTARRPPASATSSTRWLAK